MTGGQIRVAVDVGGSGARLGLADGNPAAPFCRIVNEQPRSMPELAAAILRLTEGTAPDILALAVPAQLIGGKIPHCWHAPWLEGDPAAALSALLQLPPERISVVNDGQAHALALRRHPEAVFGAIHFALGTEVAFGVLDTDGQPLHALSGGNWEIGDFPLPVAEAEKGAWKLLGSIGFEAERGRTDCDGYASFGKRLGAFAAELAIVFRPRTVGFSGGIPRHNWNRIEPGFQEGFSRGLEGLRSPFPQPKVLVLPDEYPALTGLLTRQTDK
jgi:hypothetical protein